MDDPGRQWPAWKFGMKREELFTTLHDQYNTVSSSIQDPEAFHHDVYEISNVATSTSEFHRLLSDRKEQRIRELNNGLESASLEIIANPSLIGTQQWQHAVQLFRTKSLDSLVRYFSSYLPDDHPWHHPDGWSSNEDSRDPSFTPYTGDGEIGCGITYEPDPISSSIPASHLPPSPRSMTMCSDESSAVSPTDDADYSLNTLTPARTLSFSEPETDRLAFSGTLSHDHDDETSQSDDPDTPTTSVSDFSEIRSLSDYPLKDEAEDEYIMPAAHDSIEGIEDDIMVSDTPTPKNESPLDSYVNVKPSSEKHACTPLYTHVLNEYARMSRKHRRDGSPGLSTRRRSPELGRVQKPLPDPTRVRPKSLVHMSRSHSRYP